MKQLPRGVRPYKRTPLFNEDTIPTGLLNSHSTKAGVWGVIQIEDGTLEYTIEDGPTHRLTPTSPGIVEPEVRHHITTVGAVTFYVEFYK